MTSTTSAEDIGNPHRQLDQTLDTAFPSSDPPAAPSFTSPVRVEPAANSALGEPLRAYLVVSADTAAKSPDQWPCKRNGRWVSSNVPVVVASLTPAGALLECLVRHDGGNAADRWMLATLSFPCAGLRRLDRPHESWRERPYRAEVRSQGDHWALGQQSLALRVPSAICPGEFNVLLNTAHADFSCVKLEQVQPLEIDARL